MSYIRARHYHSFFALGRETVGIFQMLDYSGIFILIAGSYAPFLGILFHGERWASIMFCAMWVTAIGGILTAAFYHGPFQIAIRLVFFLGMGWAAIVCLPKFVQEVGCKGTAYLVVGGVLYTAGIPFFVKGSHTFGVPDHAIWHVFVILASTAHFLCILWYVIPRDKGNGNEAIDRSPHHSRQSDSPTSGKYSCL